MCADLIEGGKDGAAIRINEDKTACQYEEHGPAGPCPKFLQQQSSHSRGRSETEVFLGF